MRRALERGYLWGVAVAGIALTAYAAATNPAVLTVPTVWLLLAFLVALELLVTRVTSIREHTDFGAGTILAVASLLYLGGAAAIVVFAWGSLVHGLARGQQVGGIIRLARVNGVRILFNVGQAALSILPAAAVVSWVRGRPLLAPAVGGAVDDLATALLASVAFFVTNLLLVSIAISAIQRTSLARSLRAFCTQQGQTMLVMLAFAPVVASVIAHAPQLSPLLVVLLMALHQSAQAFQEKHRQALHDPLTGLPNRLLFNSRLAEALERARAGRDKSGLLLIDLDDFKSVNDTYGHHTGDRVLTIVAQRLLSAVRDTDTVARLGGDEFGIVLGDVSGADGAEAAGDKVRGALRDPIACEGLRISVPASVGLAISPDHGSDADSLFRHADATMYADKRDPSRRGAGQSPAASQDPSRRSSATPLIVPES